MNENTCDRFGLTKQDYIRIWKQDPTLFVQQLESDLVEHTAELKAAVEEISNGEQYQI